MLKMEEGSFVLLWHEEDKGHFSAFSKLTCLIHSCLFFKDSELLVSRYANDIFFSILAIVLMLINQTWYIRL